MSKNRTSITERLRKSKNRQTRLDFAHDWADKWEQDYLDLIEQLKRAKSDDERIRLFGDLGGLNRPKFNALHNVIDELDNPTRELED